MTESVKQPPRLKKRQLTPKQQKQHNTALGKKGENRAVQFLSDKGYKILDTNLRLKNKEVDIIALDTKHDEMVFVEVKTRATDFFGDPSNAVSRDKIGSMKYVATVYMNIHNIDKDYRFDIISVLPDKIEHFESITF